MRTNSRTPVGHCEALGGRPHTRQLEQRTSQDEWAGPSVMSARNQPTADCIEQHVAIHEQAWLAELLTKGDERSLSQLCPVQGGVVYAIVFTIVRDRDDAEVTRLPTTRRRAAPMAPRAGLSSAYGAHRDLFGNAHCSRCTTVSAVPRDRDGISRALLSCRCGSATNQLGTFDAGSLQIRLAIFAICTSAVVSRAPNRCTMLLR